MTNLLDTILPDLVADIFPVLTGQSVTVRTYTDTSDPATGIEGTRTSTDLPITSVNPLNVYFIAPNNSPSILAGDAEISLPALALSAVPTANTTTLVVDDIEWRIINVTHVRSGVNTIMYTLQLRQ